MNSTLQTFLALAAIIGFGCSNSAVGESQMHQDGHDHSQMMAAQDPIGELKPVKVGKYQVELWPPDTGLYAGEPVDVEFGVFDSEKEDPTLGGMLGIDFTASASVTMPEMAGMPAQKPKIHREGRVGVQGLELYFPHGGTYKIDLNITPKGGSAFKASFTVAVADEKPADTANVVAPYKVEVVGWNKSTKAGTPAELSMQIIDTKTGKPVTDFDVAHEKRFHLLLASKNLKQFLHEHPEMQPDGTWVFKGSFPAGGPWLVFADVAPSGAGSRIIGTTIHVVGSEPTKAMYSEGLGPSSDQGLTAALDVAQPIEAGKMVDIGFKLTDTATRAPITSLEPYLGAAGHLMIFHEDGQTVVHSHPAEDEHLSHKSAQGEVHFNARFPKPGRYIAYAQFQQKGVIKTVGFTLNVD